jgi:hypothetical protein
MSDKNSFLDDAIAGLSNLTRLEVNTIVGNYTFNKKGDSNTTIKNDSAGERMCSQINLVTGDITTAMTEKFVVDYKELREYHTIREDQGHEIVKKNIEVLRQILSAIVDFTSEKTTSLPAPKTP